MAILDPIKLIIDNYPEGEVEYLDAENNMENETLGTRKIAFSKELYIERSDFEENPPKKYYRFFVGNEVRLRNAYFVKCTSFEKDENGNVTVIHGTYDPETKSGTGFTGRKVKGTIHFVSAKEFVKAEVRQYDYLFKMNEETGEYEYNENSINVNDNCIIERTIEEAKVGDRFQFIRNGYYILDRDSTKGHLVFNEIVGLKDNFNKK